MSPEEAEALALAAKALKARKASVPPVADNASGKLLTDAATGQPMLMLPPRGDTPDAPPDKPAFGDLMAKMSEDSRAQFSQFMRGTFDKSQSPSYAALPPGMPDAIRTNLAGIADIGLAALSGVDVLYKGAAGLAGDVAGAVGVPRPEALARDLAALPEAFAGSPGQFARAGEAAGKVAAGKVSGEAKLAGKVDAIPPSEALGDSEAIGKLVAKAAGGSKSAKAELAARAAIDPEALAAAKRLGIDLPADVFSDDVLMRTAAGLTRSEPASKAEAAWITDIRTAADKADEAVAALGGSRDLSKVSADVLSDLQVSQARLEEMAGKLYDAVDVTVKPGMAVKAPHVESVLTEVVKNIGKDTLSDGEKALLAAIEKGTITYARLKREKSIVGKAIDRGDGPFGNMDIAALKRLYGAIVDDQLSAANEAGGDAARSMLTVANALTAKKKDLEKSIVGAFGKDLEGSIARRLEQAVGQAGKGDTGNLNRVMAIIPEDLRSEVMLTAIAAATKSKSAAGSLPPGSFGFAEYAKFYSGLRDNTEAYKTVASVLSPEAQQVLSDLFVISKRVTDARGKVIETGRANKALLKGMTAESIMGKIIGSSAGQSAATGVGAGLAGPGGAMLASGLTKMLARAQTRTVAAAGELFRDPAFIKMMEESAAIGTLTPARAAAVAESAKFKKWYSLTPMATKMSGAEWLLSAAAVAPGEVSSEFDLSSRSYMTGPK